jgi:hypothetical protein
MKHLSKITIAFLLMIFLAACNRNYYSGSGKGGKDCGCPSHKGMSGF